MWINYVLICLPFEGQIFNSSKSWFSTASFVERGGATLDLDSLVNRDWQSLGQLAVAQRDHPIRRWPPSVPFLRFPTEKLNLSPVPGPIPTEPLCGFACCYHPLSSISILHHFWHAALTFLFQNVGQVTKGWCHWCHEGNHVHYILQTSIFDIFSEMLCLVNYTKPS
jgi:hypothetical protein